MRRDLVRLIGRFSRLFALLVWAGQLGLAVAPMADAHAGQSAAAHVETSGASQHVAHNPDLCPGCIAQALVAVPVPPRVPSVVARTLRGAPPAARALAPPGAAAPTVRSRAPPGGVIES